jgi:hypothetical protein
VAAAVRRVRAVAVAATDMDAGREHTQTALAHYKRAQPLLLDCWELEFHLALHYYHARKVPWRPRLRAEKQYRH